MHHPALDLFRDEPGCTLGKARFPRWWKVVAGKGATTAALLSTTDPLLVEQRFKKGKVLLCTVPLDRSWDSTLPSVGEFPVLAHELVYYLADTRSADFNVPAGQPLVYRPEPGRDAVPATVQVYPPWGKTQTLTVDHWPLVCTDTRTTGAYRLETAGRSVWYVVEPDPRESDLTPSSARERELLAKRLPILFENDWRGVAEPVAGGTAELPLGWLVMIGVMVLLCGEIWMTRRMAAARLG
jgi:hypothetical protein